MEGVTEVLRFHLDKRYVVSKGAPQMWLGTTTGSLSVVSSKWAVGSLDPTFIEVQVRQIEIPKSDTGSWRLTVDLSVIGLIGELAACT